MALFGVPMTGADICGFLDDTNEELCARWIEVGAFYPFVRDHSALNTIPQELYRWDSVAEAARNVLSMRYQMLPYIYTLFYNAHTSGELVTRALWANFPSDARTIGIDGQFMLGKALVAPKTASVNGVALDASQIVFDGNSLTFVNLGIKISDLFELAWE